MVTNQNRGLLFDESGQPTARANKILTNTPMGRFGEAEELVGGSSSWQMRIWQVLSTVLFYRLTVASQPIQESDDEDGIRILCGL